MKKLPLIILVLLASCALPPQMVWVKTNAKQGEFEQARYACLQQSQQYSSSSYIAPNALLGGYQGSSSSGMGTNDQLFGACMNSKGFYLQAQNQNINTQNSNAMPRVSYGDARTSCLNKGFKDGTYPFNECIKQNSK